ncbi:patatin-like phospholipase family protein [Streptomyces sp. NBC_01335]|uniref:patatin-like phospholipase family protein n=1 Tax=unclassified Streptomyces TaxID=2593676 RepID=UPI002251CB66|nr:MULTISPECIES: patatin-like phospholipase family protein [unclassified Streptomyces]MCX5397355.1 patatin-like phospholipase family protein [Streptomyces sp. NBC_00102]WSI70861.1 patatin-like phospholipase family protein [Streptomyces sp. NBC_01335]
MNGTALVLGGGGPVGGAWLTGVLAGLAGAGIELDGADVVIGTSAGAVFGSRLRSGVTAAELYDRQLSGADAVRLPVTARQTASFLWAALGSRDPQRSVERLARTALRARTGPESDVFDTVGALLGDVHDWPERELRIAAVDAASGRTEVFDSGSGATLLEAVAASCAVPVVWPPVTVAGRRWMDGGSRSTTNLHLAHGYERVLALAPVPRAVGPHPSATRQAAQLSADGTRVLLLSPDRAARRVMGRDMTADARRPAAARAGRTQAGAAAASVAGLWHG